MSKPLVSIVVATMGRGSLARLLESIRAYTEVPYEIVLVAPKEVTFPVDLLSKYNPRLVFEEKATGCVSAYNIGFKESRGEFLCHLNDDCEVCPNWMSAMLDLVGDRDVQGAFYLKEPDTNGFIINYIYGKLYGNFSLAKKSLFERLGYWSSDYIQYGGDPDFSLKVWNAGYEVVATPDAKVIHHCIVDEHRKEHMREEASNKLHERWGARFANARS